jgi:hypothetical protein
LHIVIVLFVMPPSRLNPTRGLTAELENNQKVAETADDAALSKLSAARLGYVNDPFIPMFVPSNRPQRRSPLINRGYFSRVAVVDLILQRFVATCRRTGDGRSQVISLGAGMDTTFFRCYAAAHLSASQSNSSSVAGGGGGVGVSSSSGPSMHTPFQSSPSSTSGVPTVYFEVDFADVTAKKASIVRKSPVLQKCIDGRSITAADIASITAPFNSSSSLSEANAILRPLSPIKVATMSDAATGATVAASSSSSVPAINPPAPRIHTDIKYEVQDSGGCNVIGKSYRLVTADLRDISAVETALLGAGCDFSLPTLLLSECVLIYLEPEESCGIIAWAARAFSRSMFVTYEQIRPHDAFGQMMMRNLEERGYKLRGLNAFPDLNSQIARYTDLGYQACTSIDMNDVYYRLLPRAEVARIERLEIFDELEEWHLMSAHYSITVACNELNGPPPQRRGGKSSRHPPSRSVPAQTLQSINLASSGNNTPKPSQDDTTPNSAETTESLKADDVNHTKNGASMSSSRNSIRTEMPAPMRKMPRIASIPGGLGQAAPPPASPSSMALPPFSPATFSNQSTTTTMAAGTGTAATGTALSSRGANNDVFQQQQQQQQRRMTSSATADTAKELAIHVVQSHQLANNSSSSNPQHRAEGSQCSSPDAHLGDEGGGGGGGGGSHILYNSGRRSRSGSRSRSRSRSITTDSSDVDVSGSSGHSHSQIRVHTHTPVDFDAIAEAEDELLHARHVREAAGIDLQLQRESDLGRISCSASVVSDRDGDDGVDALSTPIVSQSGSAFPAAVEGSKKLEVTSPFAPWNAQAILVAAKEGKNISLFDCLFPNWQQ